MGYSATKAALDTLERIEKTFQSPDTKSQVMRIAGKDYYFERGRENFDGAVTGTLQQFTSRISDDSGNVCAFPAGSVRIRPDGTIARFPRLRNNQKIRFNVQAAAAVNTCCSACACNADKPYDPGSTSNTLEAK